MFEAEVEELRKAQGAVGEGSGVVSQEPDARMAVILDLSSKVTEQESEITRLREQLRKHNLSPDADGTLSVHSDVSETLPKFSDTGCRQLPAQQNSSTDAAGSRGVLEESSNLLRYNKHNAPPTGKFSDTFSLNRTSQRSVESYFKNYTKREKSATSFRAHWASSCFDVDDLTNDDAGAESKTGVSDDPDMTVPGSTQT